MEAKQTEVLKISTCKDVVCYKCKGQIKNCDDCTEDAKVRSGLINEPDRSKCCHLTAHFCSVKKLEIERIKAKQRYEFVKNLECNYCGTRGSFRKDYNELICKVCRYSFNPRQKSSGKLPKEVLGTENQEINRIIEQPQKKEDIPEKFIPIKSKVTGNNMFTVGEFRDIKNLKKGEKIIIGP